ncbi:MAG: glycosyltransferase family 4 protein [Candidatus Helarchaeota archaeon]
MGNYSSGIVNHNKIFINYLHQHPEVEQITVLKYPFPEDGKTPPYIEKIKGVQYITPRLSLDYHDAFKSILQADLSFMERLKIRLMKLALRIKGIKQLDVEQIKKWGKMEYGLLGIASVELPFPNKVQQLIGKCIRKLQPDIIQSHVEMFSIAGSIAKESAKGHISYQIIVEEERESLPPRSLMSAFWTRLDMALQWLIDHDAVDTYIAASKYIRAQLQDRGVHSSKIQIIQSPLIMNQLNAIPKSEARKRLGIPLNKRVILSVGRLIDRKRFIDIIQILKDLPEDVIFYLKRSVSTSDKVLPSAFNDLQKFIKRNKLEQRVIINSDVLPYERMQEVYSAADVAVYPFLYEPFGMCAAEAMAAQRPLIVYDSGYLPEFVQGNGFTVEPLNLDILREKIQYLLENPKIASEMGEKGHELAKKFDIELLGEKLLNIYREYL